MSVVKLMLSLLSVLNKLLRLFADWKMRRQIRRSYHNEQITKQQQQKRRASKARLDVRRAAANRSDDRLQDDGYRRD